jgi:hypothetical protein
MKFLPSWLRAKPAETGRTADTRDATVSRVANRALDKYEKTFKDLARYDRGETFRPVSK